MALRIGPVRPGFGCCISVIKCEREIYEKSVTNNKVLHIGAAGEKIGNITSLQLTFIKLLKTEKVPEGDSSGQF